MVDLITELWHPAELRKQWEYQHTEARFDRYCNGLFGDVFGGLFGGDEPQAPDPNPGIIANAQASEKVGLEQVQLGRDQFAYQKERNVQLDDLARRVVAQQMGIADKNQAIATDTYDYYKRTYRPLEEQIVAAARAYDPEGTMVNQAIADTKSAFGSMRGQAVRQANRYGFAPNPAMFTDMNIGEAAAVAGNANRARTSAIAQRQAMLLDAAALGRDKPMNSTASFGTSLNAGNSAIANQNSTNAAMNSNLDSARGWYGQGTAAFGNAGNLYGLDYNGRMNAYTAQMQGYSSGMAGLGQLAGTAMLAFAADGGEVDGPGGPRDDAIPARLSDGEYVIPADVVKAKGTEYFDRLLEKYHKDGQKQAPPPPDKGYKARMAVAHAAHGGVVDRRHMMKPMPMQAIRMMREAA